MITGLFQNLSAREGGDSREEPKFVDRKPELLLADVDERTRTLCRHVADELNCELVTVSDRDALLNMIRSGSFSLVLFDARLIPDARQLLSEIKGTSARTEVVLLEENASTASAVRAIKAGFSDYLEKPLEMETLERAVEEALKCYQRFQPSIPTLEQIERQAIEQAMAQAEGDKIEAARLLSIGKTTLYRKLRQYGTYSRKRRGPARHARSDASMRQ